jgi:hypothetical protein
MIRDRVLMTMVGVSLLFHLSMVTLFSIYVWVPVNRPKYAQLEIKYLEPPRAALAALNVSLRIPDFGASLPPNPAAQPSADSATLSIETPAPLTLPLPEISLPSLDSVLLERAEMIASGASAQSAFRAEDRGDSWARLIGWFEKFDDRLRNYTSIESVFPKETEPAQLTPIAQPVEGIAVYVEWIGDPRDRKLELGARIDSLWRLDPKALNEPLWLAFKVNAEGEVVYVLTPPAGDEILEDVGKALKLFRFVPLDDPNGGNQYGTLVIARETNP